MPTISLNDPLDEFLQSRRRLNSKISCNISSMEADQLRHTLLWRQDPEESFSDWKIILKDDIACVGDTDSAVRDEKKAHDGEKNDTASAKSDDNDKDGTTKLSTETAPLTKTFHVHRNILASVSTYFRSLFRKRKHSQTSEHQTQTSIIKLHPEAIKSFPMFLDYVYNGTLGKLGFERSNAVALRHLAMYFGVDTLFKEISELILLDFRNESFQKKYNNHATFFNDEKLLLGLTLQHTISKILFPVFPGIFSTIYERPEVILEEENSVLSSWRHVKDHICQDPYDPFFTLKNSEKFSDITVTGTGLGQVDGIYNLFGVSEEVGAYTNGVCTIVKLRDFWRLSIPYFDRKDCDYLTESISLYDADSDTDYPPSTGWYSILQGQDLPALTIISKKAE
jgi:hypothetical protein